MLIEILLAVFIGILAGTITGILPGIHINLVGAILVGLTVTIFSGIPPIYLIIFIASMAIAHTFIDFIPSIFLGCPDTDTQLSVLPGHEMLKEGRGYEAVRLTSIGGILAIFILIVISFPLSFIISKIYNPIHAVMFWILISTCLILILTEKNKISALFIFIISGILGLCVLNLGINEPLLPMLTGLFGSSMLIGSIKNKIQIPPQEITEPKEKKLKPVLGSVISSPLCGFLPGLGSGQAAILGSAIFKTDKKGFLVLIGATNILVMGFSFVSLYAISKVRTGAAAAIQDIIGSLSWKNLTIILFAILLSGILSFFLVKTLAKIFSQKIHRINYSKLSIITLVFLVTIVFLFSGFIGILILISSTLVGIYANSFPVKKTQMMGCLLIPTLIYYFSQTFG